MHHNRRSPVLIKSLDMVCIATMIVALGLSLEPTRPAHAAAFTVTKTADTNDGTCNADCSLREAVVAANAAAGADSVILPAGTYTLTIAGLEDLAAQGDLDLNGDLSLAGAGANLTTIDAAGLDRVFDIAFGLRVTLSGLTISGGDTAAVGGGILSQGNLTVTNSTLSGNTAASGGGVFGSSSGTLTLRNTTVSGNSAGGGGGGLTSGGALTVTNSTISGNSAGGDGGGLHIGDSAANFMNVTVTDNIGGNGGGIYDATPGMIHIRNSLLAGNMATGGGTAGPDCAEGLITLPIISQGYNLVGDNTNCSFASSIGDQIGTGGSPIDPGLGPLRNNGGPTLTHALRPDSPAIDAGNPLAPGLGGGTWACEAADQRGQARTVDGDGDGVARCDIGAFEMNYTLAVDRADDFAPASFCTAMANDCSLRGAIRAANGSPEYDIILVPAGTYTLTLPGIGDNLSLTGDLDINSSLAVTGAGAVTIDGNGLITSDRVFHVTGAYTVTISNVTIRGGNNSGVGGGLANPAGSRLTLLNTTLVSNTSSLDGGGLYSAGALTITHSTLSGNTAGLGGGGLYSSGALTITNSTISGNTAASGGGLKSSGPLTITNSTFSGNIASAGGGGLMSLDALTLTNSTLSGNTAGTGGGGLYSSGPLTITNSTLSGNTAGMGGGLATFGDAATLNNVTVASNTVTSGDGGGILRSAGTVNLLNTLLAGNSDLGGQAPDCWGFLTSLGHNLVGSVTGCTFSSATGDQVGSGANPIDPRLGPLQDNGGFTPTHALQGGGPAIDAGEDATCAAADQRGVARPFGRACDVGAFELDVYALYLPQVRR